MRVEITDAPGYMDRWEGKLLDTLPHPDGHNVSVVIADDDTWHVVPETHVRPVPTDTRPLYDACGCIFPCPDHKTPTQDGNRDRAYWSRDDAFSGDDTD
jgi:hypothetical protein